MGSDPELFIVDKDGVPVAAHLADIPPAEDKRMSFDDDCYYFRDGYAVEINVPPSGCSGLVIEDVIATRNDINYLLEGKKLHLEALPSVEINLDDIKSAPKDVRMFGCNPS